ncbi:MAG: hypothetical protein QGH59_09685, partial [Gemmatimonadota bacterium]|nr:hypothetical protein [Gemmatimonadota bacterium]
GTILSVPVAMAAQWLKKIPTEWLPPAKIPVVLAFVGLVAGWGVGHLPAFAGYEDAAMLIGGIAGGGSGSAYKNTPLGNGKPAAKRKGKKA